MARFRVSEEARWMVYLGLSLVLLVASGLFLLWSVGYMERGSIATSLLSALIGFTLLSSSLYTLRLSAYVYSLSRGVEGEGKQR
jgi:hypothetical protein